MSSNPPAGVISKKLKFKGEKSSKSKKRSRVDDESRTKRAKDGAREDDGDDDGEDGMGWTLPKAVEEAVGPAFIIFPTDPPTCLAVCVILFLSLLPSLPLNHIESSLSFL